MTHPATRRRAVPGLALLCALAMAGTALAQAPFGPVDAAAPAPQLRFSATRVAGPILPGAEVVASGQGFRPGQRVSLLYGTTPLLDAPVVANAEGRVEARLRLPAQATAGNHPVVVVAEGPYGATVATLKVSPDLPLSGQDGYAVTQARVSRGLYQSAYSARNDALFVTAAVGRPPVRQSELLRLDPGTLAVTARISPQPAPPPAVHPALGGRAPAEGGVFAVYGIGVDDANDTVWVTNTRQNTVAVYRQADLSLLRQFEPGTVYHPRDIAIHQAAGKAYVSATFKPEVAVFDTRSPGLTRRIEIPSRVWGRSFSAASLSLDAAAHRLYVVSNTTNEVAVIDTRTDEVVRLLTVPGARSAIGVSHDPQTGRIFVAAQESDNLVVLEEGGQVVADTPVGGGPLNVVFDPVRRRAYVSVRAAGTVAVLDADGRLLANLGPAPLANHAATDGRGTVFVVDRSTSVEDEGADTILRIDAAAKAP